MHNQLSTFCVLFILWLVPNCSFTDHSMDILPVPLSTLSNNVVLSYILFHLWCSQSHRTLSYVTLLCFVALSHAFLFPNE